MHYWRFAPPDWTANEYVFVLLYILDLPLEFRTILAVLFVGGDSKCLVVRNGIGLLTSCQEQGECRYPFFR